MLVLGVVLFIAFLVWDGKFAKKPFVPYRMTRNRTVVAACVLGMLDFLHFSVFSVFFPSYLQVVGGFSPGHATRIDNSLRVSFQVASLFVAVFMKYTRRSQIFVLIGVPLCVLGQGILIYLIDMGNGRTGNDASFVTAQKFAKGTLERAAIDRSYRESQRILAIAGIAALAPMLIVMFFLKNVKLDERRIASDENEVTEKKECKEEKSVK
ncbi:hypothetical protein AJ80_00030 [Polytolypa hystricis UAMH7299]|uniref:Major facilitator superfamily (MFS) profile domain-containing protein n=1 Tax=Polytolypa hystricis (strain UAMH7299) TaxID=1447883 RepID=A0A2B7Z406_POLH7|nr:hypothetical protein AJ80_00030 [Polytolypa hystricis UAMH7299]